MLGRARYALAYTVHCTNVGCAVRFSDRYPVSELNGAACVSHAYGYRRHQSHRSPGDPGAHRPGDRNSRFAYRHAAAVGARGAARFALRLGDDGGRGRAGPLRHGRQNAIW